MQIRSWQLSLFCNNSVILPGIMALCHNSQYFHALLYTFFSRRTVILRVYTLFCLLLFVVKGGLVSHVTSIVCYCMAPRCLGAVTFHLQRYPTSARIVVNSGLRSTCSPLEIRFDRYASIMWLNTFKSTKHPQTQPCSTSVLLSAIFESSSNFAPPCPAPFPPDSVDYELFQNGNLPLSELCHLLLESIWNKQSSM